MQEIIAIGEIWAGIAYIVAGFGLLLLTEQIKRAGTRRSLVKLAAAGILLAAGVEEMADAFIVEGENSFAIAVQFICTLAQVAFNSLAVWVVFVANRWQWVSR